MATTVATLLTWGSAGGRYCTPQDIRGSLQPDHPLCPGLCVSGSRQESLHGCVIQHLLNLLSSLLGQFIGTQFVPTLLDLSQM
jgi:hypothetical protein